ncbi:MAG: YbfB/YjiJ family MFS transporter, partial [Bradyrhizobiaceae bacterium]|nr:YbfB/YjiJ family MFS transporter [Bradyrhizobiaceae bacterium]
LVVSATTTASVGLQSGIAEIVIVRFIGGVASAFAIVCASTLVLDQLTAAGRGNLVAIHFAGVGAGIFISAAVVAAAGMNGAAWQSVWVASGSVAALAALLAAALLRSTSIQSQYRSSVEGNASKPQ